jgi:hypothetical protein
MSVDGFMRGKSHKLSALDETEPEEEGASLLETVVNAHYLALQMRMLAKARKFNGSEATELLACALTEWAQLAGGECFEGDSMLAVLTLRDKH